MDISRKRIIRLGKRLKDEIAQDDISGGAAELAYRFFLALFPFFIFLAALGGFVASASGVQNPTDEIMDMIGESLPADSAAVLRGQLESVIENQNAGLLSVGILGAIWAASAGVSAMMKNMNRIYDVTESRPLPVKYAISVGLTILGAGTLVLAFVVLFVGQLYGPQLAAEIGLEDTAATLLSLARWPIALGLILAAVAFIYWLAPNADVKLKWITPGAVVFAIAWVVATLGFGFYVSNFGSYNETYGALGGVVILLVWFYLTSFLLLLGVEINEVLAKEAGELAAAPDREDTLQAQPQRQPQESPGGLLKPVGVAAAGMIWLLAFIGFMRRRAA